VRKSSETESSVLNAKAWQKSDHSTEMLIDNVEENGGKFKSHSLSGGERNHLFIRGKTNYSNITNLSGLDTNQDSRSFAILDYNDDGWMDIALASTSNPRLRLYKNKLGEVTNSGARRIRIKLIGGNTTNQPSKNQSNRDGYGAVLRINTSAGVRVYQHQAGEGLSAQNSDYTSFALSVGEKLEGVSVTWPSKKVSTMDPKLKDGSNSSILTIREP